MGIWVKTDIVSKNLELIHPFTHSPINKIRTIRGLKTSLNQNQIFLLIPVHYHFAVQFDEDVNL